MQQVIEIMGLILRSTRKTNREACCVSPMNHSHQNQNALISQMTFESYNRVCFFRGSRLLV